ncbi:MAG: hypothetical protein GQ546_04705 [Gammaproteobacteria bacterium]|nr:hypothetical protein [Gammaproteobacteria bacterium]
MNNKDNKFSSAMGDLKGLLNQEGINLNSDIDATTVSGSVIDDDSTSTFLPTLDGTITVVDEKDLSAMDIDDEQFDLMDFTHSKKELEEQVASITREVDHAQIEKLKIDLSNKLSIQIEKSVSELKIKLLESMKNEIDAFFKK